MTTDSKGNKVIVCDNGTGVSVCCNDIDRGPGFMISLSLSLCVWCVCSS